MDERILLKSVLNNSLFSLVLIGGLISFIVGVNLIVSDNGNYGGIIMGAIFSIFGIYAIYKSLTTDILEVTKETLIIKSIFGSIKRKIKRLDIISYNEIEKENAKFKYEIGYVKWKDLTLFLKENKKYTIHSTSYKNYDKLRRILISVVKRNQKSEKEWYRKNSFYFGVGFFLFGFLTFTLLYLNVNKNELSDNVIGFVFFGIFVFYGIYLIFKDKSD